MGKYLNSLEQSKSVLNEMSENYILEEEKEKVFLDKPNLINPQKVQKVEISSDKPTLRNPQKVQKGGDTHRWRDGNATANTESDMLDRLENEVITAIAPDLCPTTALAELSSLLAKYRRGGAVLTLERVELDGARILALGVELTDRVAPEKYARAFEKITNHGLELIRALELENAPIIEGVAAALPIFQAPDVATMRAQLATLTAHFGPDGAPREIVRYTRRWARELGAHDPFWLNLSPADRHALAVKTALGSIGAQSDIQTDEVSV